MPVIVVCGNGRNVGKTSLVCALIEALPEFRWTAVKISTHAHQSGDPIWQETAPGQGSDTARYLAAGARRAFLVTAPDDAVATRIVALRALPAPAADWIFESNRVLDALEPDLCLAVVGGEENSIKPSFARIAHRADASVRRVVEGVRVSFEMAEPGKVPAPLLPWVRTRLGCD